MNAYKVTAGFVPYPGESEHDIDSTWIIYANDAPRAIQIFINHWWMKKHRASRFLFSPDDIAVYPMGNVGYSTPEGWAKTDDRRLKEAHIYPYDDIEDQYLKDY